MNIEEWNRKYREAREIIREMYGDEPPFDADLVARVLASRLDELRQAGVDVRQVINTIADAWDSTLSRGELKGIVEDAINTYVRRLPEYTELDTLMMELSALERDIDELEDMIEEATNEQVKAQLEIQRAELLREAEKLRRRIEAMRRRSEYRRIAAKKAAKKRRARKKRVKEKVVVRPQPAPPAPPRPAVDAVETGPLTRFLFNVPVPEAADKYRSLEAEIGRLPISSTLYRLKRDNTYMALVLGNREVAEGFSEIRSLDEALRLVESDIREFEKEWRRKTRQRNFLRVDWAERFGEDMGYLKYLITEQAVREGLERVQSLFRRGEWRQGVEEFQRIARGYMIPAKYYGLVEELADIASQAARRGETSFDDVKPLLDYAAALGVKITVYPKPVLDVLSRIHEKNPCARAELFTELYGKATGEFKSAVRKLCTAISRGRRLPDKEVAAIRGLVRRLPLWEADMLETILSRYEEVAEEAPSRVAASEAAPAPREAAAPQPAGIPAILPTPRIVSRSFQIVVEDRHGERTEVVVENDLDEDTYHILCMIMELPEEIFVYTPPSRKYSKFCPIQYYIRRDLKRGTFHVWFPVYGPRIIEWAKSIVKLIEDSIVTGKLSAQIWMDARCEKFAKGMLGW